MSTLKTHYFAGAVAAALGINPVTLRMWRDRGYCDLGAVEEGAEDNPRARRRYTAMDACMMGVAIYLNRFGWSLEEAFGQATRRQEVRAALVAVILENPRPDTILSMVNANASSEEGNGWGNILFLSLEDWKKNAATAFDATDYLTGQEADGFFSFNISAIARRVTAALVNASEGGEDAA